MLPYAVVLVLLVLGLWLLRLGFVRVGSTWFCAACAYDLTGLDLAAGDARCPECGHPITNEAGRRRGAPVQTTTFRDIGIGLIVLALGLALGLLSPALPRLWP